MGIKKYIAEKILQQCEELRLAIDSSNDEAFKYILEIEVTMENVLEEAKREEERNEEETK